MASVETYINDAQKILGGMRLSKNKNTKTKSHWLEISVCPDEIMFARQCCAYPPDCAGPVSSCDLISSNWQNGSPLGTTATLPVWLSTQDMDLKYVTNQEMNLAKRYCITYHILYHLENHHAQYVQPMPTADFEN